MRTMARRPDGSDQALGELKGVDAAYPLVGTVEVEGGKPLQEALRDGAVVDPALLERLNLKVGDRIALGSEQVPVAGVLKSEPDGITDRLTYGPRILVSDATLEKLGLIKPGTLVRWRYAMKTNDTEATDAELGSLRERIGAELPEAGFTVADRRDPSPQVSRTLDRLRQFLTLIGLTALLVGGVGIANAVATFIDKRRKVIATMKSIGATSRYGARHLPHSGAGGGGDGRRHRPGARHAGAGGARRAVRRHAADPGRDDGDAAEHPDGARLRVRRRAAVHAVAAGARRARQRQHAVPRRGGAGAHAAAPVGDR